MRWLDGITDSMDMSLGRLLSWWWTGRPGMLRFMGLQRVGHNWVTKLNWTKWMSLSFFCLLYCFSSSHLPFLTSLFLFIFTGCQISIESIIFQITICKNCLQILNAIHFCIQLLFCVPCKFLKLYMLFIKIFYFPNILL